jgi:hypothetical protein
MTCNPNWPEITEALEPGQTWEDRADVVNRVFHAKLQQFIQDLRDGLFFDDAEGKPWQCLYVMHVVEWQKRGKPHAHITLRFKGREEDMPKTARQVDALIWARIPPVHVCPCGGVEPLCVDHLLQAKVKSHMLHRCAVGVCLEKDGPRVCRRHFPKAACAETTQDPGGYPIYRREAGDSNVVSYNPRMLLRYDCHINVELCSTVWVHKYMVRALHGRVESLLLFCSRTHLYYSFPAYSPRLLLHHVNPHFFAAQVHAQGPRFYSFGDKGPVQQSVGGWLQHGGFNRQVPDV